MRMKADLVVLGGGLAGLVASHRAAATGRKVALIDLNFSEPTNLGGFAAFSGAKFSFYPAGRGLETAAGGSEELIAAYERVADFLGRHSTALAQRSMIVGSDKPQGEGNVRSYQSILLSPAEIRCLLAGLSKLPPGVELKQAQAKAIGGKDGDFAVEGDGWAISAPKVVVAAGRIGSDILSRAGCIPQEGKGLDVGVRLEFSNLDQVASLRAIGPDAKILLGATRTFCLNAPGEIYHYPAGSLKIPGGVVAARDVRTANFGILHRCSSKVSRMRDIASRARQIEGLDQPVAARGPALQDAVIATLFGSEVATEIERLQMLLHHQGLVDFDQGYLIHRPLLDWHWPVYGLDQGFETSVPGIFCVGDASGVARGLLQAAASGWICVERLNR